MRHCELSIIGTGEVEFKTVFKLLEYQKAVAYTIKDDTFVYYWYAREISGIFPFPFELVTEQMAEFAWWWLNAIEYPETDNVYAESYIKGWKIYNEAWGHVNGDSYAFVGIKPWWIEVGK